MQSAFVKFAVTVVTLVTLLLSTQSWSQTPVWINWTAVTGAQSDMFMAQEEGLFKKNGLDSEPEEFMDMRFVAELHKQGFFK